MFSLCPGLNEAFFSSLGESISPALPRTPTGWPVNYKDNAS